MSREYKYKEMMMGGWMDGWMIDGQLRGGNNDDCGLAVWRDEKRDKSSLESDRERDGRKAAQNGDEGV